MGTIYPAHIRYFDNIKYIQSVQEHCRKTAQYAVERLNKPELYNTVYIAGLLHDMGKYTQKYKIYIEKASKGEPCQRGSVNHTFCAVIYLFEKYHVGKPQDFQTLTCEIISYAIGAHHGEFDCVDLDSNSGFEHRVYKDKNEISYDEAVSNFLSNCADESEINNLFMKACGEIEKVFNNVRTKYKKEGECKYIFGLIARMLLSAVIDGDRRDTAEFMTGNTFTYPKCDDKNWLFLLENFNDKISLFDCSAPINKARKHFSDLCYEFSKNKSGIYKLTLPTGAGKTLSSLRYSLSHAAIYEKRRILFVIPLLSVLDQNSKVIRDYINNESIIVEHHSNVIKEYDTKEELDQYELLAQTWESPIIITTLVQLLNALFSHKTTAIRRMSALENSIIIIDEIQSLPKKLTYMFNMAMNYLALCCNCTIVLSSATQPCFNNLDIAINYSTPCDIVEYQKEYFDIFKRTDIIDKTTTSGMNIDELVDFATEISEKSSSLLIICNTKGSALSLFRSIENINTDCEVYHLSTSMCTMHRKDTLVKINDCLDKKRKIICVSTQLVEAGIDFSFESVIRVEAGIDNIAQAAGRCNRSNDYGKICNVYIVNLKNGCENLQMLKEILSAQNCTLNLLYNFKKAPTEYDNDILSEKSISTYYKSLYNTPNIKNSLSFRKKLKGGINIELYSLLSTNTDYIKRPNFKTKFFFNQAFKTAGTNFEVFDENTHDVIVPYNEQARHLIAELCSQKAEFDYEFLCHITEETKPYTIHLYDYQLQQLWKDGMIYYDINERFLILEEMCYDEETGFRMLIETENYII